MATFTLVSSNRQEPSVKINCPEFNAYWKDRIRSLMGDQLDRINVTPKSPLLATLVLAAGEETVAIPCPPGECHYWAGVIRRRMGAEVAEVTLSEPDRPDLLRYFGQIPVLGRHHEAPALLEAAQAVEPIVVAWFRERDEKYGPGWNGIEPNALDALRAALAQAAGNGSGGVANSVVGNGAQLLE